MYDVAGIFVCRYMPIMSNICTPVFVITLLLTVTCMTHIYIDIIVSYLYMNSCHMWFICGI